MKKIKIGALIFLLGISCFLFPGIAEAAKGTDSTTGLKTPRLVEIKGNASSITLKWKKVSGAEMYRVYRKNGANKWKKIAQVKGKSTVTYKDKDVKPGIPYTYTVRACRKVDGKWKSSQYDTSGLTASRKISRVKLTSAVSAGGKKIVVTWQKVKDVTGYRIYRKEGSGKWQQIASVKGASKTTVEDTGLSIGKSYTYTVRAYTQDGAEIYTGSYDKKGVSAQVIPATSKITSLQYVDSQSVEMNWKKVSKASGYRIYRKSGSGGWKKLTDIKDGNALSYVDKTAKVGTRYTYRVRAYTLLANKSKCWGLNSATKKIKASIGVDISKWDGNVNWTKVKKKGIEFVMLRIGHGGEMDVRFTEYFRQAKAQGLKVGVYYYTTADSVTAAKKDLKYLKSLLKPYKNQLDYPVAVDFEEPDRMKVSLREENTKIVKTMCQGLQKAGYDTLVYSSASAFIYYLNYSSLKKYGIWLARWVDDRTSSYHGEEGAFASADFGPIAMWQYDSPDRDGSKAQFDMNIAFVEY